jgi:hypothetical protein
VATLGTVSQDYKQDDILNPDTTATSGAPASVTSPESTTDGKFSMRMIDLKPHLKSLLDSYMSAIEILLVRTNYQFANNMSLIIRF